MIFVRDRNDGLRVVLSWRDNMGLTRLSRLPLEVDMDALLLGFTSLDGVLLDTAKEVLTRSGVANVLDADVDALLDVAVADTLVDNDTDSGLGHVVDDTSPAMVDLVRHTVRVLSHDSLLGYSISRACRFPGTAKPMETMLGRTNPFCTAPLTTMSTMSPTLYYHQMLFFN